MKKLSAYSVRTAKEILRDPMTLGFGVGFPVALLLLLSAIQANVPVEIFEIHSLTPGIAYFGLTFMALFSSLLVSKDRESAFMQRVYTAPVSAATIIFGYLLPMLPIAFLQSLLCYLLAFAFGLTPTVHILSALAFTIPSALFFISLGLLLGSVLNSKAVGVVCGAVLCNFCAWLSGAWFDLQLVGGWLQTVADFLPFTHGVELGRAVLLGEYSQILPHILWTLGYLAVSVVGAILLFLRQMKRQ